MTQFTSSLAHIAEGQYDAYHFYTEGDPVLAKQIQKYWEDLNYDFPGVGEQWSAVFVSWCMKSAGASKNEFKFAERHAVFVNWAIANAKAGTGLFRGHGIDACSPKIGDIIANNQPGHAYDFDYAATHDDYHSHSAIVIEKGTDRNGDYVLTVGGNESDSVQEKTVYLKNGLIVQRTHMPFIAVIEDLK
ncbi:MAG TPA: DUF2272 domain-containing protein [Rhizomicrobium sp.]